MAQAVYLIVDGAVLFDIGIGAGDIGLRLVVVVVGDEIFHGVVREKRAELGAELGGQRLVVGQHQRRTVALGDDVRHREGLSRPCHAQQCHIPHALTQSLAKPLDRPRLIPRRLVCRFQTKFHSLYLTPVRCSQK